MDTSTVTYWRTADGRSLFHKVGDDSPAGTANDDWTRITEDEYRDLERRMVSPTPAEQEQALSELWITQGVAAMAEQITIAAAAGNA